MMVGKGHVVDEAQIIGSIIRGETHLFHDLIRPYERRVYLATFILDRKGSILFEKISHSHGDRTYAEDVLVQLK